MDSPVRGGVGVGDRSLGVKKQKMFGMRGKDHFPAQQHLLTIAEAMDQLFHQVRY